MAEERVVDARGDGGRVQSSSTTDVPGMLANTETAVRLSTLVHATAW